MEKEVYSAMISEIKLSLMGVQDLLESNKIISAYNRLQYVINSINEFQKNEKQNGKEN